VPVIRLNYMVLGIIRLFVIFHRRPHKTEVHEKFRATTGDMFSCASCQLLVNVGLFFEVEKMEWAVFEYWWRYVNVLGEYIQLTFTRGVKSESPYFGLNITSPGSWHELQRQSMQWSVGGGPHHALTLYTNRTPGRRCKHLYCSSIAHRGN
jgi:hypothetical protein